MIGFTLAALIGISLGLLGGGGSILAVPILAYVVGMPTKAAIAASLLVVGTTSIIGAIRHWSADNIDVRTALAFGVVSMAGSFAGGKFAAHLSDTVQLTIFAVVMLAASASMFRSRGEQHDSAGARPRLPLVITAAALVGLLTGIVGVGGGFLIVPALVLFSGLSMRRAVGTSLLVIAMNSASGFIAYAGHVEIDWSYTTIFTLFAIGGVFIGSAMVPYVSQVALKRAFAVFLVAVASLILYQNTQATASPDTQVREQHQASSEH